MEVLLLDIDAELSVWDDEGRLLSEEMFPVAELAYWLMHWLQSPDIVQAIARLLSHQQTLDLIPVRQI